MKGNAFIARHVDGAAEVQRGVEHRQRLVLGHVDLIQHAEAAGLRTLVDGALPQLYGAVFKGVRAQQGGGVCVDVEGHVPAGAAEHGGQVFRQHILASGLGAYQQQVLSAEDGGDGLLPDVLSIIEIPGIGDPAPQGLVLLRIGVPKFFDLRSDVGADAYRIRHNSYIFIPQKFQHIQHSVNLPCFLTLS